MYVCDFEECLDQSSCVTKRQPFCILNLPFDHIDLTVILLERISVVKVVEFNEKKNFFFFACLTTKKVVSESSCSELHIAG